MKFPLECAIRDTVYACISPAQNDRIRNAPALDKTRASSRQIGRSARDYQELFALLAIPTTAEQTGGQARIFQPVAQSPRGEAQGGDSGMRHGVRVAVSGDLRSWPLGSGL